MAASRAVICVFCGSSPGKSPSHLAAARDIAHTFHKNQISLVYGGGTVGLMGELAKTLVNLSGSESVHGIIPAALLPLEAQRRDELANGELERVKSANDNLAPKATEQRHINTPDEKVYGKTTIVPDMHTRKRMMSSMVCAGGPGSGFIALSGGYGTLEELMEVVTWNQLGIHDRGVCVYNVDGYWDGIMQWVKDSVEAGFVQEGNKEILKEGISADECVKLLKDYTASQGRFKLDWNDEGASK